MMRITLRDGAADSTQSRHVMPMCPPIALATLIEVADLTPLQRRTRIANAGAGVRDCSCRNPGVLQHRQRRDSGVVFSNAGIVEHDCVAASEQRIAP